jgi:hypothetical protein
MKKLALLVGLALFISVHSVQADTLSFIAGSDQGTVPALNDNGEIIWANNGPIKLALFYLVGVDPKSLVRASAKPNVNHFG